MQNLSETTTTQTTINIWERQPGEPDAAYTAFLAFLDLPLPRRVVDMEGKIGYSQFYLRELSAKWDWRARAAAYEVNNKRLKEFSRADAIHMLQEKVITDVVGDLNSLLAKWRETVQNVTKPTDFQRMVQSRLTIDNMFRRAAELPGNYLPQPTTLPQEKEDEVWELDLPDGRKDAGKITAASQVSDSDFEESGEVQGTELWAQVGEEFLSEE